MAVDNRNFVNVFANEGGGDVLVEDKRMSELVSATGKTGSQISTTEQYIPLQDVDGNLVKINAASFQEAVRNTLGSLLANNDKGTTISGIPALSGSGAGLDFGSVTPANLASVLGGEGKLFPFVGNVHLTPSNLGEEQLDSSLSNGFYSVSGYNSGNVIYDDGLLLVYREMRVKFGRNIGCMALRGRNDTEWHLYTT